MPEDIYHLEVYKYKLFQQFYIWRDFLLKLNLETLLHVDSKCTLSLDCSTFPSVPRLVLLSISLFCSISSVVTILLVLHYRRVKVFKYSSPTFLSLTLIGCAIMYRLDTFLLSALFVLRRGRPKIVWYLTSFDGKFISHFQEEIMNDSIHFLLKSNYIS